MKSEIEDMNDNQRITWHYVMDIHDPEDYWYSRTDINKIWR